MPKRKPPRIESLAQLIQDVTNDLAGPFAQMEWAEDEITHAGRRHPTETDTLFHSFRLLQPTHRRMTTEFVYRAHCREILDRVAGDADTRPATAVEICCACGESSQIGVLTSPATGLYFRMWAIAFPDKPMSVESLQAHEVLEASRIDDLEATMRNKLTAPERTLGSIDCAGRHHGETVPCRYHAAGKAA